MKLKPFPKFLLIAAIVGGVIWGLSLLSQSGSFSSFTSMFDKDESSVSVKGESDRGKVAKVKGDKKVRVGVVTWGGYAGGQYFNGGFKPSAESRYKKEYGLDVEFLLIDDYTASRNAWKAGEIDLLWTTADSYPTEVDALRVYDPRIAFQADWSRGGDVALAVREIKVVSDLRGRTVACAYGTPSHTFLLNLLDAGGLTYRDVKIVEVPSAINAAESFKAGRVDAAMVWSPHRHAQP